MIFRTITYEKTDNNTIATVTLNRPEKLNAMDLRMYDELDRAFEMADCDREVRVAILTGAGDRAFCAGDDISIFQGVGRAGARAFIKRVMPVMMKLEKMEKPVIAAVNGYALGGGFEFALACDLTIASENASFGLPEGKVGLMPAFAVLRLAQVIGVKRAKELALTAEPISAHKALEFGIVNQVVPLSKLLRTAKDMARKIITISPLSAAMTKAAINRHSGGEEIEYTTEAISLLMMSEDHKEGYKAFLEKRAPRFKGK
ncbi:MAG: enoyl-CoA hydratase/isomerase family protein [Chloroflexi bacterium]|nr:enoyl-CoA hydratase/isomerase family protein [Chloroflexota bacterium]